LLCRESFQCGNASTTSMSQTLPGYTVDSGSGVEDDYNDISMDSSSNSDSNSSTNSDVEFDDRTDDTYHSDDDDEAYSIDDIWKERLYKDDLLSYKFDRVKQNDGNIEDVFDGALYQSLYKHSGILSEKFNISQIIIISFVACLFPNT